MTRIFPPVYVVKVIKLDGTVITSALPCEDVSFSERLSRPGDQQLGGWSAKLIPARGPNAHYMLTYSQLDYMQRIEIYENVVSGQPVFSGQISDLPTNLVGGGSISGSEWLNRLTQRTLRHFEFIGGEAARNFLSNGDVTILNDIGDQMAYLLKTWQPTIKDNFNGDYTGWTVVAGSWITETLSGYIRLKATAANSILTIPNPLSGADDDSFRVQVDILAGAENATWGRRVSLFNAGTYAWHLDIDHIANEQSTLFTLTRGSRTNQRSASWWEAPLGEWMTVDLWCYNDASAYASGQTVELWLNGRQYLDLESDQRGYGGKFALISDESGGYFDNFILWELQREMVGTIAATSVSDETEYPGDTYLQALSALADMLDWEWRTTSKAGAGNDLIQLAETVGSDVSATVRFEEGKNLVNLSLTPTSQNLITHLKFKGQGQDANQRLAEACDFAAWDDYGIIEESFSDNRISTNELARRKCENELVRRKDGKASLNATVVDTVFTAGAWRVGDYVWVKSTEPDLNRLARVVEVSYQTNSILRQVTFDSFPRSRSGNIGRLMDDVGKVNRGTKGNAAKQTLEKTFDSWFVDDFDPRIKYSDGPPSVGEVWQSWTGGLATGAWAGTLHGTSEVGSACTFGFWGTQIAVIARTAPNLVNGSDHYATIQVDDLAAVNKSLYSADTTDRVKIFETTTLDPGYHEIAMSREGDGDLNIYIDLDAFLLKSLYWPVFVEGKAVNSSVLSWKVSHIQTG